MSIKPLLVVFLVLSLVLFSFQQIEVANAEGGVIYIKANGAVEGTDKIQVKMQSTGNVYRFVDDINESIIVQQDNAVIDGAGYVLQGAGGGDYGIKLESSGVTVKNAEISNFKNGIYVYLGSDNNVIIDNNIHGNSRGIYVRGTDNNTLTGNNVTNNGDGIYLSGIDNVLKNNQMKNNNYNFGFTPQPSYNDIDTSNTVDGKPIYYWTNQHDSTVPLDAGCVILINCTNIKAQNLTLTNNKEGIVLINSQDSEIKNCSISNNKSGIRIRMSSSSNVTQNIFSENGEGVTVWESTGILVDENQVANSENGIEFFDSQESSISDNSIVNCSVGIECTASSNNNTLSGNRITSSSQGILFSTSYYNILRSNHMVNSEQPFTIEHDSYTDAFRELPSLINDVDSSNTVGGKPMYYWINQKDRTVPSDAGYVALVNCTNITVKNLEIKSSGILAAFTTDSQISQNNVTGNYVGIKVWRGSNNSIAANSITGNKFGLNIFSGGNDVYWNNISDNTQGVIFSGSLGNNIFRNRITNNKVGMCLDWADNNTIYNNNFIDNDNHVYDSTDIVFPWLAPSSNHNWNQTITIGGNYWSNFTGIDQKSGENQNLAGSDGIIDTAFVLYTNNTDYYPLVKPLVFFDAGIWEWNQYYVNCITNSTVSEFSFDPTEGALVSFTVTGENGTTGFCRVTVPKELLTSQNGWNVIVNGESVTPTVNEDIRNSYIYFTYNHSSKTVEIVGTDAIPEFPTWIILPIFVTATLSALIAKKKLISRSKEQS